MTPKATVACSAYAILASGTALVSTDLLIQLSALATGIAAAVSPFAAQHYLHLKGEREARERREQAERDARQREQDLERADDRLKALLEIERTMGVTAAAEALEHVLRAEREIAEIRRDQAEVKTRVDVNQVLIDRYLTSRPKPADGP